MAKTVKHRKRFPGHIVQFPRTMFVNKNEISTFREWLRSDQLHHPGARGRPWCLLRALQVLLTKFQISALMFSREARSVRPLVLRWKIHRFPVRNSTPRRNVKISYSWFLLLNFFARQHHMMKNFAALQATQQLLMFTRYSICCISFGMLEKAVACINSELMVPLWNTNWLDG